MVWPWVTMCAAFALGRASAPSARTFFVQPHVEREGQMLKSTAREVAELIRKEKGCEFKARWSMAWDALQSEGSAQVCYANDGRGPTESVLVTLRDGVMVYLGPFEIEQMPTTSRLLMFECTSALWIRDPNLGPPDRN